MKVLEFETSKGKFVLIDKNNNWCFGEKLIYYGENKFDALNIVNINESFSYSKSFKISEITEEQASEIVDDPFGLEICDNEVIVFKDYEDEENTYLSSIDSLYSLIFSKGIHLFENPVPQPEYQFDNFVNGGMCESWINKYQEQEQKTFYNPYIFKL